MNPSMRTLGPLVLAAAALVAGDAAAQIPCKFGSAWALPGGGHPTPKAHYLRVEGGDELQNPSGITLDLWFWVYEVVPAHLLAKGPTVAGAGKSSYELSVTADGAVRLLLGLNGGTMLLVSPSATVSKTTWHRIVATYRAVTGEASLYVDGVHIGTSVSTTLGLHAKGMTLHPTSDPLHIGCNPLAPQTTLLGAVDEVRIWTRALSLPEILATAVAPLDGADGLAASFHLDGTGLDLTGGHLATPVGAGAFVGKCASFGHYGEGIRGTGGEVPYLSLDLPPVNGTTRFLLVGNPTGHGVPVLLTIGTKPAQLPAFGGTLLVEPLVTTAFGLPPLGDGIPFEVPSGNQVFHMQSFLPDAEAPLGVAASRGLFLYLGT